MRILIVDDEAIERRFLETIFSEAYPEAIIDAQARNGVEAMKLAQEHIYNLAIVDIRMARMDGLELSSRLREISPEMTIIVNTAFADFDFAQKAIQAQVDAYLLKPTSKESILTTVQHLQERVKPYQGSPSFEALKNSCLGRPIFLIVQPFLKAWQEGDMDAMQLSWPNVMAAFAKLQHYERCIYAAAEFISCCIAASPRKIVPLKQSVAIEHHLLTKLAETRNVGEISSFLQQFYNELFATLISLKKQENPSLVDQIEDYILQHYRENFALDDLASEFFHNGEYLSRLYRQERRQTINQRMHQLRIIMACKELRNSQRSIERISGDVGYSSLSHFYANFKKIMRMTPSEYRKRIAEERRAKVKQIISKAGEKSHESFYGNS